MRTYRTGGTMGSLLGWNALVVPVILILLLAPEERPHDRPALYVVAGLLILAGPVALLAYLVRWSMVRVAVGPAGLTISELHEVGWGEIRSVELRGWRPKLWNAFKNTEMNGCMWGCRKGERSPSRGPSTSSGWSAPRRRIRIRMTSRVTLM